MRVKVLAVLVMMELPSITGAVPSGAAGVVPVLVVMRPDKFGRTPV